MLESLVAEFENEIRSRCDGYVRRAEEILSRIAGLHDPASIGRLLKCFDDNCEYDEIIFSMIHLIEVFGDEIYVREILHHLPDFWADSPRWAVIVHMRILNSRSALVGYAAGLKSLSSRESQVVYDVLNAIRREDAKFEASVDLLLAALPVSKEGGS